MTVGVLYIDRFSEGEESLSGEWPSIRLESPTALTRASLAGAGRWILRSRRLSLEDYCSVSNAVRSCGSELVNTALSFGLISSLRAVHVALSDFGPPMIAGRAHQSPQDFISMANVAGLKTPLFIRSEIESAAKYVGFDGCVVSSLTEEEVEAPIRALRQHVGGFNEIALKEIWEIKKLGRTDIALEYRTVGYRGELVAVDLPRGNLIPRLEPVHIQFLNRAYAALAKMGADGVHVLDLAIRDSDRKPYIVEWKDLSSSSLRNAEGSLAAIIEAISARSS